MEMERIRNCEAFYTSRVDDEGNELEVTHSARTIELPPRTTRSMVSSHDSSRSVQYVNTAVYIEKAQIDDSESAGAESLASVENSDIVPPLDLQSEENYPTRREGFTFSYRNHYEPVRLVANPGVAYNNWWSAKRKIISDEAARRKRENEAKLKAQEERKRLAAEKYEKWLKSKDQQPKPKEKNPKKAASQLGKNKASADGIDAKAKLEEWERKKRAQEERRRELKQLEEAKRKRDEEKRRLLSDEAWNKWIAEAPYKPKPVPLNQGIDTLRGTISEIFINPNEWRTD